MINYFKQKRCKLELISYILFNYCNDSMIFLYSMIFNRYNYVKMRRNLILIKTPKHSLEICDAIMKIGIKLFMKYHENMCVYDCLKIKKDYDATLCARCINKFIRTYKLVQAIVSSKSYFIRYNQRCKNRLNLRNTQ